MLNCQGLIKKLPQIEQVFLQQNSFFYNKTQLHTVIKKL